MKMRDVLLRPRGSSEELVKELCAEMSRQDEKWGWPFWDGALEDDQVIVLRLADAESVARRAMAEGRVSCVGVLAEEVSEAARETDPEKRVAELVQVAAVALSWAQAIQEEGQ